MQILIAILAVMFGLTVLAIIEAVRQKKEGHLGTSILCTFVALLIGLFLVLIIVQLCLGMIKLPGFPGI